MVSGLDRFHMHRPPRRGCVVAWAGMARQVPATIPSSAHDGVKSSVKRQCAARFTATWRRGGTRRAKILRSTSKRSSLEGWPIPAPKIGGVNAIAKPRLAATLRLHSEIANRVRSCSGHSTTDSRGSSRLAPGKRHHLSHFERSADKSRPEPGAAGESGATPAFWHPAATSLGPRSSSSLWGSPQTRLPKRGLSQDNLPPFAGLIGGLLPFQL